ncbi:hypothetical protein GE300_00420 [Rhodobacteraceae bacterium 2CG4]|uniref:DM13 domain-containing protein n=1 Tax=Halovulum marinum TaxID=2662447 RepID=A0A6L5YUH3_9RHOB|nr:DM13 domain-containing protein [Halovulum marinum]MSU88076.1 hypothetical protein [Halovulum marinum]
MGQLTGLLTTVLGVLAGFVAGVVSVQLIAPDLLRQTPRATVPAEVTARIFSAGDFSAAGDLHRARGRAQLLDAGRIQILRFTEFRVTPGPDLRVLLSTAEGDAAGIVPRLDEVLDAGPLDSFAGDQTILLPEGLDPSDYGSVLLWEAEFGQLYAVATLER